MKEEIIFLVNVFFCFDDVSWKFGARPVLYLKNNIYVSSGDGTVDNPKTVDNIEIYIIIFSITIISLITIYVYKNRKEI